MLLKVYYHTPFQNPVLSGNSASAMSVVRVPVVCKLWDTKKDEFGEQCGSVQCAAHILRLE
jgi:hypothetical protein